MRLVIMVEDVVFCTAELSAFWWDFLSPYLASLENRGLKYNKSTEMKL